jgi:hypothetical protein
MDSGIRNAEEVPRRVWNRNLGSSTWHDWPSAAHEVVGCVRPGTVRVAFHCIIERGLHISEMLSELFGFLKLILLNNMSGLNLDARRLRIADYIKEYGPMCRGRLLWVQASIDPDLPAHLVNKKLHCSSSLKYCISRSFSSSDSES